MDAPRIERGSLRCERSVLPLNYRPVEIHSQALSIALEQIRQRYLCFVEHKLAFRLVDLDQLQADQLPHGAALS